MQEYRNKHTRKGEGERESEREFIVEEGTRNKKIIRKVFFIFLQCFVVETFVMFLWYFFSSSSCESVLLCQSMISQVQNILLFLLLFFKQLFNWCIFFLLLLPPELFLLLLPLFSKPFFFRFARSLIFSWLKKLNFLSFFGVEEENWLAFGEGERENEI